VTTAAGPVPVLVVAPSSVAGGAERALAGLVARLPHLGYQPSVALFEDGPLETWLDEAGCPVTRVHFGRLRNPRDVTRTVGAIRHQARRTGARLILGNTNVGHIYGGMAAASLRLPAVWWQQTIPSRRYGGPLMTRPLLDRLAARVPAALVVASSAEAAAAQRELTPRRRVEVVPLGIDLDRVRASAGRGAELRRREGLDPGPVVGMAGWIWPWKGQDVFLRAAAAIAAAVPTARFVIVGGIGDGTFRTQLDRLVAELGLDGRVVFAGDRPEVYDWFDAMDVAVHASWGEAFGLVLVEAMALGTPVVATSAGGPSEIVEDGTSGFLVPPGDHAAMAGAIARALAPAEATALGAGAAARAERFSTDRMAAGLADLLDDVLRPG
jgi:glycosyltransferase involved in cell wall biosynthesis